jgi:hypothetical protein
LSPRKDLLLVRIAAVGDVALVSRVGARIQQEAPGYPGIGAGVPPPEAAAALADAGFTLSSTARPG